MPRTVDDEITKMAGEAEPFAALINPDRPAFISIGNMPRRILFRSA